MVLLLDLRKVSEKHQWQRFYSSFPNRSVYSQRLSSPFGWRTISPDGHTHLFKGWKANSCSWMFQPYCRCINEIKSNALFKSLISLKGFLEHRPRPGFPAQLLSLLVAATAVTLPLKADGAFLLLSPIWPFLFIIQTSWGIYSISRGLSVWSCSLMQFMY